MLTLSTVSSVFATPPVAALVVRVRAGLQSLSKFGLASLLAAALIASGIAPAWSRGPAPQETLEATIQTSRLPAEARDTLALIRRGGPFRYRQDDSTFGNRERLLPSQPRGYYREYTVVTPGSRDRGARRIIAGGQPPAVFYYTDDHYRSFRRITD